MISEHKEVRRSVYKGLKAIARQYGLELKFCYRPNDLHGGQYTVDNRAIRINTSKFNDTQTMLSAVFHEIAHEVGRRNGKYAPYYYKGINKKWYSRFALRAELYTDWLGKKLMAKEFPAIPYKGNYCASSRHWLMCFYGIVK
jgi:hypothetical protein